MTEINSLALDLEPAKKFFNDAIRLTFTMAECMKKDSLEIVTKVPVDCGECVKMSLYDEYKGVTLQKFYAKKDTSIKWKKLDELSRCHGFVLQSGDMKVLSDNLNLNINLPKDKHFFYIKNGEDIQLQFNEDTWFYVISLPETCI